MPTKKRRRPIIVEARLCQMKDGGYLTCGIGGPLSKAYEHSAIIEQIDNQVIVNKDFIKDFIKGFISRSLEL
jgi:hypothetical protein